MRKLFTLLLAAITSVGTMFAESGKCGDNLTWDLNEGVLSISGTGAMENYSYDNTPWYSLRFSIESVIIPNSITSIGEMAFYECSNIKSVIWNAKNCNRCSFGSQVESFVFGNSVDVIPALICSGMYKLTSVTIPNSVISIGESAFGRCEGLISVAIPNSVTNIGNDAFRGCSSLTSIEIPNSVTSIGEKAFAECTALTSVTIPIGLTSIRDYTFAACFGLTAVSIPNSVISIGIGGFNGCTGLKSMTIPNSVTSIGEYAFAECNDLTSVTIGNSVTSIGYRAFYRCSAITSITCEAVTPPTCDKYVFEEVYPFIPIYVPANSVDAYKETDGWDYFLYGYIQPIQAIESTVTEINAKPTNNSVVIEWPAITDATIYTIEIKKGIETICTISFDAEGKLLTISLSAPSRNGNSHKAPMATQTATGWQYTITGLDANTEYTYTVIAKKDESDTTPLLDKTISFKTTSVATSLDQITNNKSPITNKIIKDNQLLILLGEKVYTATGQEVR